MNSRTPFPALRIIVLSLAVFAMVSVSAQAYAPKDAKDSTVLENVRDGVWGLVFNVYGVGVGAVGSASVLVGKVSVVVCDVTGLVVNNKYTRPVFRGWLSELFADLGDYFVAGGVRDYVVSNDLDSGEDALSVKSDPSDYWTTADDADLFHSRNFTLKKTAPSECSVVKSVAG